MKILVLNGSPKRDQSDVMHVTNAFLDGMKDAGQQQITVIHVIDCHIEYCTGCFACMRGEGACVIDDDMKKILAHIIDSDQLLFSFPLYCYGMPAPLKALVDRILPLSKMTMEKRGDRYVHVGQTDVSRLHFLMICGCGFPNGKHNFEPAVLQFGHLFPERSTVLTIPESPMFNAPAASPVTVPKLALVRAAGKQYAKTMTVSEALRMGIEAPMIPEEEYAEIVNNL